MTLSTYGIFKSQNAFGYSQKDLNGEGDGTPLQYSCLENPMDRGARPATVHGVADTTEQLAHSSNGSI